MEARRLFDCIDYQLQHSPLSAMFAAKEGGKWREYPTSEVRSIVDNLSVGLMRLGIGGHDMTLDARDKIAVLSRNRPEWMFLDLATQQIGAVLTPVYPTINVNELRFILNDAQVKLVFVSDQELYHKVVSIRNETPSVQEIFSFDHVVNAKHWKEILALGTQDELHRLREMSGRIGPEDLVTIIYTSGTTGVPKGVMLSHRNILSNVMDSMGCFHEIGIANEKALSFLPLNHIFERMVTYVYLFTGVSIYYAESLETIGDNLKEVKPALFTTVPRLLEKTYEKIMAKAATLKGIKKKLFYWALGLGQRFEINKDLGFFYNLQLSLANKLVFSKWRQALGGNIRAIVTGSAACQVKLLRIFTAARIVIMEGYGLTETSPVISVNRYVEKNRKFGTVGPLIPNVEVRIAEDGEILCKGPNVMMGYYKRPDLTGEVLRDEWFYTGDIGTFEAGRFLKITDRKKEIFKTSGGKYVAPLPIENKMKESQWIEQIMVVGAERKFTGALIVPSFVALKEWCAEQEIPYPGNEAIIRNEKVVALVRDTVDRYNQHFNQVEQVKRFELLPGEWTIDGGELTPTLKLKRKVIMEKYRDAIERIYA
ncbi:MAG TPA: long-chain fatty acid--CoA ligase [Chitinophagaceae bacterium]|nr:long-chain fatty acid--CoA ligase [Chitinophagaceae bacterium]